MSGLNETDYMIVHWRNQRSKANEVIITQHRHTAPLASSWNEPAVACRLYICTRGCESVFDSVRLYAEHVQYSELRIRCLFYVCSRLHVDQFDIFTWMISSFGRTQCVTTTIDDVTLYICLDMLCLCLARFYLFSIFFFFFSRSPI